MSHSHAQCAFAECLFLRYRARQLLHFFESHAKLAVDTDFTQVLDAWNKGSVTTMKGMFCEAQIFNWAAETCVEFEKKIYCGIERFVH
jgi:hypothetical protein